MLLVGQSCLQRGKSLRRSSATSSSSPRETLQPGQSHSLACGLAPAASSHGRISPKVAPPSFDHSAPGAFEISPRLVDDPSQLPCSAIWALMAPHHTSRLPLRKSDGPSQSAGLTSADVREPAGPGSSAGLQMPSLWPGHGLPTPSPAAFADAGAGEGPGRSPCIGLMSQILTEPVSRAEATLGAAAQKPAAARSHSQSPVTRVNSRSVAAEASDLHSVSGSPSHGGGAIPTGAEGDKVDGNAAAPSRLQGRRQRHKVPPPSPLPPPSRAAPDRGSQVLQSGIANAAAPTCPPPSAFGDALGLVPAGQDAKMDLDGSTPKGIFIPWRLCLSSCP